MRKRIFGALIAIALCSVAWGQSDIFITGTNYYTVLARGAAWGSAVNNNFVFSPFSPNTQLCLYVTNNNPTNSHSFTVTLWQAGDPQVKTFQNIPSKWATSSTSQTFPVTVNAVSTKGIFFNVTAAAMLTAQFTGASSAGGSPDTADIFAVQTTSGQCGLASGTPIPVQGPVLGGTTETAATQFPIPIAGYLAPGSNTTMAGFAVGGQGGGFVQDGVGTSFFGNGLFVGPVANSASPLAVVVPGGGVQRERQIIAGAISMTGFGTNALFGGGVKTNLLEMGTDLQNLSATSGVSFLASAKLTNPTAGATLLHSFNQVSSTKALSYKYLILSCSAACELQINRTSAQGATCSVVTVRSMMIGNGGTFASPIAQDIAENGCTTAPTASFALYDLQLPAGGVQQIETGGLINPNSGSSGSGLDVIVVGAVTGITTATVEWVEQ